MKNYAKVGGKQGKPGYRTPSSFLYRKYWKIPKLKTRYARYSYARYS